MVSREMRGSGAVSNLGEELVVQDTGIEGDSQRFLSDTSLSSKIYVQTRRQEGKKGQLELVPAESGLKPHSGSEVEDGEGGWLTRTPRVTGESLLLADEGRWRESGLFCHSTHTTLPSLHPLEPLRRREASPTQLHGLFFRGRACVEARSKTGSWERVRTNLSGRLIGGG